LFLLLVIIFFKQITLHKRSWNFIQQVGGIKIEKPLWTEDGLYLPIICNVSGLDSITTRPTTLNSGLICADSKVSVVGNKIYITIVTGLISFNDGYRKSRAANIGDKLQSGHYFVYYKDETSVTNLIGEFNLEY
jgi:hypothetical protein